MSLRVSPTPLIEGALVVGNTGLGVLGSTVPSSGSSGASYLYNDLTLPADNNIEVRGLIVTPPSVGTFFAFEDGSFTLTGAPDGSYSFVYRLFADGVDMGTTTATVVMGALAGITGGITLDDAQMSGVFASVSASSLSGNITLDNALAAGALTAPGGPSNTLLQDLQALLLPLVAGGAWYNANTQEPPTYPYISWVRVSSSPNVTLQGPSALQNTRIQIDIFSLSASESQSIETALEAAFNASAITNVPLSSADQYEDMVRAYRITKDYSVWATN
jgi:hypothetical protein